MRLMIDDGTDQRSLPEQGAPTDYYFFSVTIDLAVHKANSHTLH